VSSPLTTHVLDTARGAPAQGVPVAVERLEGSSWKPLARGVTDADGRCPGLLKPGQLERGTYRLRFDVKTPFYPYVEVVFDVSDARHHHVPLLLSPFGYSTYRGS
jgi:5-hydroxyisourate hydrolase